MENPTADERSPKRRALDEQIASEAEKAAPKLSADAVSSPVEKYFGQLSRHPVAVAGIVENGLVRPLDPVVRLPEHSRVIIVASESC